MPCISSRCVLFYLPQAALVHQVIFRKVRKSSESRYDHSSTLLRKTSSYRGKSLTSAKPKIRSSKSVDPNVEVCMFDSTWD